MLDLAIRSVIPAIGLGAGLFTRHFISSRPRALPMVVGSGVALGLRYLVYRDAEYPAIPFGQALLADAGVISLKCTNYAEPTRK